MRPEGDHRDHLVNGISSHFRDGDTEAQGRGHLCNLPRELVWSWTGGH
jgi:hypothetical protein